MRRKTITLALLLAAACGDEDGPHEEPRAPTDASSSPSTDTGTETVATPSASGSESGDAAAAPTKLIPLIAWVDDLIDHHTNSTSSPDTVDDKPIEDTEDVSLFDKYFK